MRGLLITVLLGVLVATSQLAVTSFFVSYVGVGLVIPCLILIIMRYRLSLGFVFALTAGIVLDSYALTHVQFQAVRLVLLAGLTALVFQRWLTNKSVYTAMVLSVLVSMVDVIFSTIIQLLQSVPFGLIWSWRGLVVTVFGHLVCSVIGFSFIMSVSRRSSFSSGTEISPRLYG